MCDLGEKKQHPCGDTTEKVFLKQENQKVIGQKIKTENSDDEETGKIKDKQIFPNQTEPEVKVEEETDVKVEEEPDVKVEDEPDVKVEEEPDVKVEDEPDVKVEESEAINGYSQMYNLNYAEWKLKNEELDIKQDKSETNKNSINEHQVCILQIQQQCYSRYSQKLNVNVVNDLELFRQSNLYQYCDQCNYQTECKSNLSKHLLRHKHPGEINMFKCDQCDYQSIRKATLKTHLLVHKDPGEMNMFKCGQCDYQSIRKGNLKTHLLLHKDPEKTNMFKCGQCKYQSIWKASLKRHLLLHRDPGEINMFKCGQCDYQSIEKGHLKRHLRRHKDPGKSICSNVRSTSEVV